MNSKDKHYLTTDFYCVTSQLTVNKGQYKICIFRLKKKNLKKPKLLVSK